MKKRLMKYIVFLELFLMISMTFSFSYLWRETTGQNENLIEKEKFKETYRKIVEKLFGNNLVSASAVTDIMNGVWTCPINKNGSRCVEYPASECSSRCSVDCIQSMMSLTQECRLGTCYSPEIGDCALNSPKGLCEEKKGVWYDSPYGDIPQCRIGCCILDGNAELKNEKQCSREAELIGAIKIFRTDVRDELSCSVLAKSNVEGACLYGINEDGKNLCKFTTKDNCISIRGNFRENMLCSNNALNSSCEKQKTTGCIEDRDEVYWFDSCGNRENIYSASKVASWNNGFLISKNESCILSGTSNFLQNARTCGNCNYLLGSVCGKAKTGEVSIGDFVCKDLNCVDENGKKRMNGESWCSYQGSTGLDENRGTDTVGSRSFRQTCNRGEIIEEPCADYRNEICVESKTPISNSKTFSTSACTINRWQECYHYNSKEELKNLCSLNPYCFVKNVKVSNDFKFNLCVPKYAPGFLPEELNRGEGAEMLCSFASQKCTKVLVKTWGGWDCKANCECDTNKFAEQMNDLCVSLGDCGTKANYIGEVSDNFIVTVNEKVVEKGKQPELNDAYLGKLVRYANEKEFIDKEATPGTSAQLQAQLGIPGWLGIADAPVDSTAKTISGLQMPIGAAGLVASLMVTQTGLGLISAIAPSAVVGIASSSGIGGTLTFATAGTGTGTALGSAFSAFAGALAGASAGFSIVSMLLSFTGVGRGLPEGVTYALMATGVVAGAIIGIAAMSTTAGTGIVGSILATTSSITGAASAGISAPMATAAAVAWVAIAVVVVFIILSFAFGIGDVKEIKVESKCMPWEAPVGGSNCWKCGSDGKPCSVYSCASLGQRCQLINEFTDSAECIEVSKDDITPPAISPMTFNISLGYEYTNVSENGLTLKGPGNCLQPGTQIMFGINLSEPGICRLEDSHTSSYSEMEREYFGVSSLYRRDHVRIMTVPTLEELGYSRWNRGDRAEYNMYVRCQDKGGNSNPFEYTINFCIQKNIDLLPPQIIVKWPVIDKVAYLQENQNVSLFTDEPSDCKWDKEDRIYSEMRSDMNCMNDLDEQTINGWQCDGQFPTREMNNTFYVKCKDQPWLKENNITIVRMNLTNSGHMDKFWEEIHEDDIYVVLKDDELKIIYPKKIDYYELNRLISNSRYFNSYSIEYLNESIITDIVRNREHLIQSRNVMDKSYEFSLYKTITPFKIDKIEPNNQKLTFGVEPATIQMKVYVSGGYDGTAQCSYEYGQFYIPFLNTFSSVSIQDFRSIYSGERRIKIKCEDKVGNVDVKEAIFDVVIDANPPKATRVYSTGATLYLVTDKSAECVFSNENCNFEFSNATKMNGNDIIHTFGISKGKVYYIKCRDEFNNNPGSLCSAIVRRAG